MGRIVDERDRAGRRGVVAGQRRVTRRREERSGRGRVTGLLEEQAEVGRGAGAEGGVLGQVSPQRLVRRRIIDVCAHERRRALALEQLAARVAQQFLIGSQREVHGAGAFNASGGPAPAER